MRGLLVAVGVFASTWTIPNRAAGWECSFPDSADDRNYVEINLDSLLLSYPELQGANTDIDLWVESAILSHPLLDDAHLIQFIHEIWYPNGNDIREIWNYFAAGPRASDPRDA